MSSRARQLADEAGTQIGELAGCIEAADDRDLMRPCPGRQKLGDGTIGAAARHTAENYLRAATLVEPDTGRPIAHGTHATQAGVDRGELLARLQAAGGAISRVARLDELTLDTVPPAGTIRFADGTRTLEQILSSILKHQRHQVDAIAAGLARDDVL